jgi:hypothetical protein
VGYVQEVAREDGPGREGHLRVAQLPLARYCTSLVRGLFDDDANGGDSGPSSIARFPAPAHPRSRSPSTCRCRGARASTPATGSTCRRRSCLRRVGALRPEKAIADFVIVQAAYVYFRACGPARRCPHLLRFPRSRGRQGAWAVYAQGRGVAAVRLQGHPIRQFRLPGLVLVCLPPAMLLCAANQVVLQPRLAHHRPDLDSERLQ